MDTQCLGMRTFTDLPSLPSHSLASFTDQLRLAGAGVPGPFPGLLPVSHPVRPNLIEEQDEISGARPNTRLRSSAWKRNYRRCRLSIKVTDCAFTMFL